MKSLSSLRFMIICSTALVLWLVTGAVLGKADAFRLVILRQMNEILIRDWILQEGMKNPVPCLWLLILILIAALLLINIVLCTWNKLLEFVKLRTTITRITLLAVHVFFFVLVLMHGVSFIWGYKAKGDLGEKETYALPGGMVLRVDEIRFVDDPELLRMTRHARTNKAFHWKDNYARVSLIQEDKTLLSRELRHMAPLSYGGLQVSLFRFSDLSPESSEKGERGGCKVCGDSGAKEDGKVGLRDVRPGVNLVFTRNPIGPCFFWVYALFIVTTGLYLVLIWPAKDER